MTVAVVRYTYRLRPGVMAERALFEEWGRCRWLWNEAVHQQRSGRKPTYARLCKLLTEARGRLSWLREGSQVAQQQMLRAYAAALNDSYRIPGRGRPNAKPRRTTRPSLAYPTGAFRIRDGRLVLAKGIVLPVVWSRELPSTPTSVRVYQDSLGHWYASFVVRRETEPLPETDGGIGVDWGVITTATTTDPAYDLPYAGHRRRCAAELAKAQRKMSRRYRHGQSPSSGYQRARREAARLRKKAARQNADDARQWARRVVADHQLIAVEGFRPTFLAKTQMARKAADAAIGAAKRELIQQGMRAGREVVLVPPAYTTMTCSRCAARATQRIDLAVRVFSCHACGHTENRDRNAARVILATAGLNRAGADAVRHTVPLAGGRVQAEPEILRP
jgi:putative transposase